MKEQAGQGAVLDLINDRTIGSGSAVVQEYFVKMKTLPMLPLDQYRCKILNKEVQGGCPTMSI